MTMQGPSWRPVHLEGVGPFEVRRPTLRDVTGAQTGDPAWWHACVRVGGAEMTKDQCLDLDADVANALALEVMKPRPTTAPASGAPGASTQPRTRTRRLRDQS